MPRASSSCLAPITTPSWIMAKSTMGYTISPARNSRCPLARASIFSAAVIAMMQYRQASARVSRRDAGCACYISAMQSVRMGTRLLLSVLLAAAPPALAQWKPDKAIEIVAPSGPGGTTDRTARVIARIVHKYRLVDVPINVVNKPGGSGTIGYTYLNQHPGDGH